MPMTRLLARLFCFIFGHRYEVWQQLTFQSRRVICRHCSGDWGMNDGTRSFIPWSGEMAEMYSTTFGIRLRDPWAK